MNYEEKRELRLQISQLLADAGLNKGVVKEMVEKEIANKVDQSINETLKRLDAQSSTGSYISEEVERYIKGSSTWYNIHDAVKKELSKRIINVQFSDKVVPVIPEATKAEPAVPAEPKDYIIKYQVLVDGECGQYTINAPTSLFSCVKFILKGFLFPASKIFIVKHAIKEIDDEKPAGAYICIFKRLESKDYPNAYDLEFSHREDEYGDGTIKTVHISNLYDYRSYPEDLVDIIEKNAEDIPLD